MGEKVSLLEGTERRHEKSLAEEAAESRGDAAWQCLLHRCEGPSLILRTQIENTGVGLCAVIPAVGAHVCRRQQEQEAGDP